MLADESTSLIQSILVWTGLLLFQTCLIYSLLFGFEWCINLVNDKQFKVYWIFEILFLFCSRFPMVTNGAQQQGNPSGPILHRSISTPARTIQQQQSVQPGHAVQSASTGGDPLQHRASLAPNHRVGLNRSLSRTEAVKEWVFHFFLINIYVIYTESERENK